eukprot:CAMPEP_0118644710 /NCGR_PEP_ID=MMETSP0785-20121206/7094_1 /TAXON_ID=91992 /ORGANISM="Bolidomonas pacifica, Strain CCMP 1866" /LENGTH=63 /DNA_ID=CAMNT_0006536507 /DNA_START=435 /DNA_END=623 /DNA_ORIENTATION=-
MVYLFITSWNLLLSSLNSLLFDLSSRPRVDSPVIVAEADVVEGVVREWRIDVEEEEEDWKRVW